LPSTSRKRYDHASKSYRKRALIALQFDSRKGATWHCIVGRNFGSFVTHGKPNVFIRNIRSMISDWIAETKHFIYFYLGHCAILLFKTQ